MSENHSRLLTRFVAKTKKCADGCIEWQGSRSPEGYGHLAFTFDGKRKTPLAHRISFELFIGPIPCGLCVLHRCDNPPCVNPLHLFLGSWADNNADRARKGRNNHPIGTANHANKLSISDVLEIRRRCASGEKQRDVAKSFNISQGTVGPIVRREIWRHI